MSQREREMAAIRSALSTAGSWEDSDAAEAFQITARYAGLLLADPSWEEAVFEKELRGLRQHLDAFNNEAGRRPLDPGKVENAALPLVSSLAGLLARSSAVSAVELRGIATDLVARTRSLPDLVQAAHTAATRAEKARSEVEDLRTAGAVGAYAEHFDDEASTHADAARLWMRAGAAAAAGLLIVGLAFMFLPPKPGFVDLPGRLLALAGVFWALAFAGRNYRASRHNEIRNRHRALTLRTMTIFRDGAQEAGVKDEILKQAALAAFSAYDTGFGSSDGEGDTTVFQNILEAVKPGGKAS